MKTEELFQFANEIEKIIILESKMLSILKDFQKHKLVKNIETLEDMIERQEDILNSLKESKLTYERYTKA